MFFDWRRGRDMLVSGTVGDSVIRFYLEFWVLWVGCESYL